MRYWYKDHLGSPAAEYDQGGINFTAMGFDTWGLRRKSTGAANSFTASLTPADLNSYASPRGYTGHEMLDEVGLIHMNGRIYDPMLGRFLQADPIIQEPYNSQNYNRYSYVINNPLSYTDPSGYSFWTEVRRPVGAIAVAWFLGPGAFFGSGGVFGAGMGTYSSIAAGFAAGGVGGGNIQSAITGAFTAGLLDGIGSFTTPGSVEQILGHAAVGCLGAGINGGSCKSGALAGGFAAAAGPLLDKIDMNNVVGRAIVGGVGSRLGGGKFANGAFTGAFNYMLNDFGHALDARKQADSICAARSGPTIACASARADAKALMDNVANEQALQNVSPELDILGGLGLVKAGIGLLRNLTIDAAKTAVEMTRVGRWMSEEEYAATLKTNLVVESRLNGITSVSSPPSPTAWAPKGNGSPVFAEFDIPTSALRATDGVWGKIYGPNSIFGPKLGITEMPAATNIARVRGGQ